nr:Arm DNA-binding domain-containing protein [Salmonella bongori]
MSLTDSKIRAPKPSATPFKLTDSQGLYLLINPGGSRLWYLKYRFNSKECNVPVNSHFQIFSAM